MALYSFQNPKTGEIKEVVQGMNEEHEYSEDGIQWERVWEIPNASVDAQIDPFSSREFVEKTYRSDKLKLGDLWEQSGELAQKRKDKLGYDPVKGDKNPSLVPRKIDRKDIQEKVKKKLEGKV